MAIFYMKVKNKMPCVKRILTYKDYHWDIMNMFTIWIILYASWLSDYLLQILQTNDTQLSSMVAEQVQFDIYYDLPNLLIWIPLLISWSLPKLQFLIQSFAPFMSACWMINTFCEYISKLTGRASSCWHQRSCDIPTNNKQSTWELHRYRQVSLLSWFPPFHMLVTSRGCMYVFLNFLQLYLSSMTAGCVRSVKH